MPVTTRLSTSLHRLLGDEPAGDLVDWMHRVDSSRSELRELSDQYSARSDAQVELFRHDVRADFAELRQEMHAGFSSVREEMHAGISSVREEMHAGIAGVRDELTANIAGVRDELKADIAGVRDELKADIAGTHHSVTALELRLTSKIDQRFADLIKWSFVFWVGAVAAVALARR